MVNHSIRVTRTALLGAIGTVVYLIETLIPFPLPFGRWGFSNFTVLAAAVVFGTREAVSVALVKSLLGSIFTGTFLGPVFFMSFFGNLTAALAQGVAWKPRVFGIFGVSLIGSAINNVVQITVGRLILGSSAIFALLPYMFVLGSFGAFANALIVKRVWSHAGSPGVIFSATSKDIANDSSRFQSSESQNKGR